jgi:hypothetical protein
MRWRLVAAGLALGVIAGSAAGTVILDHHAAGRGQSAFFVWAADTGGTRQQIVTDRMWITHHHRQVLAEGNRACGWIAAAPNAMHATPARRYSVEALADRYIHATAANPIAAVTASNRRTIAVEAWGHLCRASRDPKIVMGRSNDD